MANVTNLFKEAQRVLMLTNGGQESKQLMNILFNWSKVFEENIALHTAPVDIKENKKGKILEINVFNNVVGAELYYRKREIISKINTLLGKEVISDVVFSVKHKKVDQKQKSIVGNKKTKTANSADLNESLNNLYDAIKEKNEKNI